MANRGTITFVFDDGYERVYQNALPLLRKYNFPAVFALPLNALRLAKTEQRDVRPWQKWLHITKEGHEIASHSVTHPDLTKLSTKQLDNELSEPVSKLKATTLIYPGGAIDDDVTQIAQQYYSAGRTVHCGFESIPPKKPMHLRSYNFSRNNFSVLKTNLLALYAWLTNSWLIETYHMIDDNEDQMVHTVKTKDLAKHLSFVSKLPVSIKTIRNVVNS